MAELDSGIYAPVCTSKICKLCKSKLLRSTFKTTIFTYGASGEGKSSLLSNLFGIEQHFADEARLTVEFFSEVKALHSEEKFGLHIVDTPGFGDVNGTAQDCANIESIMKYINRTLISSDADNHTYPNAVLFCVSAANTRLFGPSSVLTKSLKALNLMTVVDKERPNVLVVITHCASFLPRSPTGKWMSEMNKFGETLLGHVESIIGIK